MKTTIQGHTTNNGWLHAHPAISRFFFLLIAASCLTPVMSPPVALVTGILLVQLIGHPFLHLNHRATHLLLQVSVVGLGFGMNFQTAMQAGRTGVLFTIISIFSTLAIGFLLGRFFKTENKTSFLIAAGTAMCGGSAIAAVAPVIRAGEKQVSVALAVIFILNSAALFLFPLVGHLLHLSPNQFGLWSALAIHDTSSVVGAASRFGPVSLEVATTVKLARALWIIPVAIAASFLFRNPGSRIRIPWFIGFFVIAMLASTYLPSVHAVSGYVTTLAKSGLTLTLFLIGTGLSGNAVRTVGVKPLLQAIILWVVISVASLWVIYATGL